MIVTDVFNIEKESRKVMDAKWNGDKAKVIYCDSKASMQWAVNAIKLQALKDMNETVQSEPYAAAKTTEQKLELFEHLYVTHKLFANSIFGNSPAQLPKMFTATYRRADIIFKEIKQLERFYNTMPNTNFGKMVIYYNAEFVNAAEDEEKGWLIESVSLPGSRIQDAIKIPKSNWDNAKQLGVDNV